MKKIKTKVLHQKPSSVISYPLSQLSLDELNVVSGGGPQTNITGFNCDDPLNEGHCLCSRRGCLGR